MGLKYALVDDHGEPLGFYDTREEAEEDLTLLDEAPDLGVIEIATPDPSALRRAALRMLTRMAETFPGGYR